MAMEVYISFILIPFNPRDLLYVKSKHAEYSSFFISCRSKDISVHFSQLLRDFVPWYRNQCVRYQ